MGYRVYKYMYLFVIRVADSPPINIAVQDIDCNQIICQSKVIDHSSSNLFRPADLFYK